MTTRDGDDDSSTLFVGSTLSIPGRAGEFVSATAPTIAPASGENAPALPASDLTVLPVVERRFYAMGPELARGGMGRVTLARDLRAGRYVAVKEVLSQDPELVARFEREARITARLQHPVIVPVYELGRWESGEPFVAMKEVVGRRLDKVIAETKSYGERLALLPHVIAVADALAYAHRQGVIHRDVKPANVIIGNYGETFLIDWGLAKVIHGGDGEDDHLSAPDGASPDLTIAGEAMGTPAYMPPEQARGEPTDERSDIYAVGALLYHVLTGEMPYAECSTVAEVLDRLKRRSPAARLRTRFYESDTYNALRKLVTKAMEPSPMARYQSATGLTRDLRAIEHGIRVVGNLWVRMLFMVAVLGLTNRSGDEHERFLVQQGCIWFVLLTVLVGNWRNKRRRA
jgi:serine/threonine protein kinase